MPCARAHVYQGVAILSGGLGDLRSNGQQLSRPFFFLKVFGDFVVPNVAVVSRISELKQGRSRVHDEGAAGVGDRRHDLCIGILPFELPVNFSPWIAMAAIARFSQRVLRSTRAQGLDLPAKRQGPVARPTCNADPPLSE